jgi:excinuclease ABC subunit A
MAAPKNISINGCKTHNLKNVSVDIPYHQLTVITGLSGSGKSSLAFDTLFAEGQRRYVQSLSTYARQFVSIMDKPDVESISGLSPAISIEQKAGMHNPRSTVGTITEIYDYMRLLYARIGQPHCPEHGEALDAQSISQIVDQILALEPGTKIMLMAPKLKQKKGEHKQLLQDLRRQGFVRIRLNGEVVDLDALDALPAAKKNDCDIIIDRLKVKGEHKQRLAESIETACELADGSVVIGFMDGDRPDLLFSNRLACSQCGYSVGRLSPRSFSFNSPEGACPTCDGRGVKSGFDVEKLIPLPELSIQNGAIRCWDKPASYYFQLLVGLSRHLDFSLETPWKDLPEDIQNTILYGAVGVIPYTKMRLKGRFKIKNRRFEGVIKSMQKRYMETESEVVRTEMSQYLSEKPCEACGGTRLNEQARHCLVGGKSLPQISGLSIEKLAEFFDQLTLSHEKTMISEPIMREIQSRVDFLLHVGLSYLSLDRAAETLSGGEAQRIRLASQIGSGLTGVMYILDEPSIGLHQRDNQKLINTLCTLRDLGNSVIVVEHDEDTMLQADHLIDIGPGAGIHGGEIVAAGPPSTICAHPGSLTGQYLSGKCKIALPEQRVDFNVEKQLTISGAATNNLQNIDVNIPVGLLTVVTGVSGSGKSSLINDTIYPALHNRLDRYDTRQNEGAYTSITGSQYFDNIIKIDQSPIGRTPRSNPATYTGMFSIIRDLFSQVPESRSRGYTPGRFSFNVRGGRCESCQGDGLKRVEMHFLADVYVTCDSCQGKRYNRETLEIRYKGLTIHEVLDLSIEKALVFFDAIPSIKRKLATLESVGLGYVKLGQSATTLSGGEAQRMKLSRELCKRDTGRTFYILDEPTTGLHFHDVKHLLEVLFTLRDHGNTIVVIEHNLDVIKMADWLIDIGPEGGDGGGQLVGCGTPEAISRIKSSHTGIFLKPTLKKSKATRSVSKA